LILIDQDELSRITAKGACEGVVTMMLNLDSAELTVLAAEILGHLLKDDEVLTHYRELVTENRAFEHMLLTARTHGIDEVDAKKIYRTLDLITPGWNTP
jgi:hypothetical protein